MSKTSIFILLVIFVLFVISILFISSGLPTPITPLASQKNSGGEVDVKVTPLVLKAGEKPQFEIEFNTHSVELDFDVVQIAKLVDSSGKINNKSTWEGSPPGGHHREGKLSFVDNLTETKSATLILSDIAGIAKREFTWQL